MVSLYTDRYAEAAKKFNILKTDGGATAGAVQVLNAADPQHESACFHPTLEPMK